MAKLQSIVDQLRQMALHSDLNKRHAAAIIDGSKVASMASNNDRTCHKVFRHINNTSICCSTHAEVNAIRGASKYLHGKQQRILQDFYDCN